VAIHPLGRARLPPSPPACSTVLRLSRSFALPLWPTSRAPVPRRLPASPPLPHGRGSWLPRGAALPGGPRGNQGGFTPHPRPLSPSRGEGCQVRFPLQLKNANPPLAPAGGEGSGVRGQSAPLGRARLPPSPHACSTVLRLSRSFALPLWPTSRVPVPRRLPASSPRSLTVAARGCRVERHCPEAHVKSGGFTPHPRPLSPSRGEGCQVRLPQKGHTGKLKEENTRIPAVLSSAIVSREAANRTHPALPKTEN